MYNVYDQMIIMVFRCFESLKNGHTISCSCPVIILGQWYEIYQLYLCYLCHSHTSIKLILTNPLISMDAQYVSWFSSGWWLSLPIWKIWVRQLGLLFPIIIWKNKFMFQSPPISHGYPDVTRNISSSWKIHSEFSTWHEAGQSLAPARDFLCMAYHFNAA